MGPLAGQEKVQRAGVYMFLGLHKILFQLMDNKGGESKSFREPIAGTDMGCG